MKKNCKTETEGNYALFRSSNFFASCHYKFSYQSLMVWPKSRRYNWVALSISIFLKCLVWIHWRVVNWICFPLHTKWCNVQAIFRKQVQLTVRNRNKFNVRGAQLLSQHCLQRFRSGRFLVLGAEINSFYFLCSDWRRPKKSDNWLVPFTDIHQESFSVPTVFLATPKFKIVYFMFNLRSNKEI